MASGKQSTPKAEQASAYATGLLRFEVMKEYAGIEMGVIVETFDTVTARYMIEQGYWREA